MKSITNNYLRTESGAYISKFAVFGSNIFIGEKSLIEEFCVIGKPSDEKAIATAWQEKHEFETEITKIGSQSVIQSHSIIYEGVKIGAMVYCGSSTRIGENTIIGDNTKIESGSKIFKNVKIGSFCRIKGDICNDVTIGDRTSFYGQCAHRYYNHGGNPIEKAPIIDDDVIVGVGAKLIGEIRIGKKSYVAAGAIITKSIPSNSIAFGINQVIPISEWKGNLKSAQNVEYLHWSQKLGL